MSVATLPPSLVSAPVHGAESLEALLARLYREQLAQTPGVPYLLNHGRPSAIANHVRTFHWYRPFLPQTGDVLDWGCQHAPDSCLLRAWCGARLRRHSCDFPEGARHRVFHDYAAAAFTPLTDNDRLPFAAQSFDAVIGSGVLEHTACDLDSLRELYRVLKPGGVLIVTYLPNWLSVNEWWRRVVRRQGFHRRLYGMGELTHMLKHHGFYPLAARYHTFFWERACPPLAGLLRRLLPIQVCSSTLCVIARKLRSM
ncbi:MAG: methyltransferase domain-containing protein [Gemmataceae bacterium]|nr:methyltransferase domain-containing protein [Gemmataceae bacterium]